MTLITLPPVPVRPTGLPAMQYGDAWRIYQSAVQHSGQQIISRIVELSQVRAVFIASNPDAEEAWDRLLQSCRKDLLDRQD